VRPLRLLPPPELIARLFGTGNPLPNLKPTWNMTPRRSCGGIWRAESGTWML
jgi:hypothetical protein